MKKLIFLLNMIFFFSCDFVDDRLVIVNKSFRTISYRIEMQAKQDTLPNSHRCKDVLIDSILPDSQEIYYQRGNWDNRFKENPDYLVRVFIMDKKLKDSIGTCRIFKEQRFVKRFDLSYEALKKMNWKIVYNGS